jgi:hypothetical protein
MVVASIKEFRATLRLTWESQEHPDELIFSYWNNEGVTSSCCDTVEVLHITRHMGGPFCLQIANLIHRGTLEELEEVLYSWAVDEGWLEGSHLI